MIRFRDISTATKLTIGMVGVAMFTLVAGFAIMTALDVRGLRREMMAASVLDARLAAEYTVGALAFGDKADAARTLEALTQLKSVDCAAIYDLNGDLFAGAAGEGSADKPPARLPAAESAGARFEDGFLLVFAPMTYNDRRFGTFYMHASTEPVFAQIWRRIKIKVLLTFLISILAVLLADRVQRLIYAPILRLADMARDVAQRRDYSVRTGIKRGDEVGALARGFDAMLTSLEETVRARDAAAAELRTAHDELEKMVADRTAELSEANKELEAFAYSASHDLRGPLRRMDGFASMIEESASAKLDGTEKDYLRRVRAAAQHLMTVIDDLFKLSSVARQTMEFSEVDLTALAGEIAARLQKDEPERRVEVLIEAGLKARGDKGLLAEALQNLLENAWKFTRKTAGPRIELGARGQGAGRVHFVKDNGCGFDMQYVDKLFRPFQRLHTMQDFPGTGIGLSTVRRIIERHAGRVWAESPNGKGAVFSFTLWSEKVNGGR